MPKITESIGHRLTDLWNEILSNQAPTNSNELWKEHLLIRREFDDLRLANTRRWKRPQDRMNCLPAFIKWCEQKEITHSDLAIRMSEHGLTLVTTKAHEEGEIIASVPHSTLLCIDQAGQIELLRKILDNDDVLRTMENVALAIMVAHEVLRGEESDWAPYLDILPPTFQTPLFYSIEQLQALKPSPAFEEALCMYRAISRQFVYFYLRILGDLGEKAKKRLLGKPEESYSFVGSPFTPKNFTFDFYRWCVSIVSTRINIVPSKVKSDHDGTPKMVPALIPFIDLANHEHVQQKPASVFYSQYKNKDGSDPNAAELDDLDVAQLELDDHVKMQLNCRLEAGEECCIYYGAKTNAKFMLHNGFVPDKPNPDDFFELKIGLLKSAPNFQAKVEFLKRKLIMPTVEQKQSYIYLFPLFPAPTLEMLRNSQLWEFSVVFVVAKAEELEDEALLNSDENLRKASKFLTDRFRLLIRGYDQAEKQQSPAYTDRAIHEAIQRLKQSERNILEANLECLEQQQQDGKQ